MEKTELNNADFTIQPINGVKKYIVPEKAEVNAEGKCQKRKSAPEPSNSEYQATQGGKRIHGANNLDDRETSFSHKRLKEEWHIGQPSEIIRESLKFSRKALDLSTTPSDKSAFSPILLNAYSPNPLKDVDLHLPSHQKNKTVHTSTPLKDHSARLPSPLKDKSLQLLSHTLNKAVHALSPKKDNPIHPPCLPWNKRVHSPKPKKDKTAQLSLRSSRDFPLDKIFKLGCVISDIVGTELWREYKSYLQKGKRKRKGVKKMLYFSETGNWRRLRWGSSKGDEMEVKCPLKFDLTRKEKLKKPKKCLWNAKCVFCNEDEVGPRTLNITRKSTYFSEYGLETSTDKLGYMSTNLIAGITAHLNCLIYSSAPGMMQDFVKMASAPEHFIDGFPIEEVKVQINVANKIKCSYCGKRGAASQCSKKSCTLTGWYHFPCGLRNGSWQDGKGRTYCSRHIPYRIEVPKRSKSGNKIKLRRPRARKTIFGSQETPPNSQESVAMSQTTREYFSSRSAEDWRIQKMGARANTILHIGNVKEELDIAFNRLTPINALDILYQMEVDNAKPSSLNNTLADLDDSLVYLDADTPAGLDTTLASLDDEDVARPSTVVRREYGGKKFIFKTREFSASPTWSDGNASNSRQIEHTNPHADDNIANNEVRAEPAKTISTSLLLMKHCLNEVIDDERPISPPSSPPLIDNTEPLHMSSPRSKSSDFAAFHNEIVDINLVSNNEVMETQVIPPTCRIIHPAFPEENLERSNDIVDDSKQINPGNNQLAGHMECRMENDNLKAEIQQLKGLLIKKEQKIESMKKEINRMVEDNQRKEIGWQKQLLVHMQENRDLREQLKTARVENVDLKEQREMKKRAIQHFVDQMQNNVSGLDEINCSTSSNLDSSADRESILSEPGVKQEIAD